MKIKKAILTGGGRATRLRPITSTINKHLLPLANKPMIFHAIEKAVRAGVTDIFINTNPGETELQKHIGDGGHWGINIKFFEQRGGPQGIAHVVNEAKEFIGNDPFMFYLSDNILLGELTPLFEKFTKEKYDCLLALSQVPDPERFGIPVFNDDGTLADVLEKPSNPPNNLAVTGIYLYGPGMFFDAFNNIEKSHRGEYEISSIHSHFLKEGRRVGYEEITGWWKDTGKPNDLLIANRLLLEKLEEKPLMPGVRVHPSANIPGPVEIGIGSTIGENVTITGPVIIAENCQLENCSVGPFATIGQGCEIRGGATVEDSMILDNATIDVDLHIKHSIVGRHVQVRRREEDHPEGKKMIIGDNTVLEI